MGEFLSKGSFLFLLWLLLSCEPWPELPQCMGLDQAELPERGGVGVCFLSKKPEFWGITDFLEELAQLLSAVTRAPFCEWSVPLLARFTMLVGLHISIWVSDDTRASGFLLLSTSCFSKSGSPWRFHAACQSLWHFLVVSALRGKSPPTVTG